MKKITALFLSFLIILTFSACGKQEKKEKNTHTVDVEYYAKIGQIPEHKYHLGSSAEDMREDFKAQEQENSEDSNDGHAHEVYTLIEDDNYDILVYENANYYYKDDGKISAVVSLDNSYDFKIGDLAKQITDVLGESEIKDGDEDAIFFLPMPENYTYLEYKFADNNLIFVFEQNALCATALVKENF